MNSTTGAVSLVSSQFSESVSGTVIATDTSSIPDQSTSVNVAIVTSTEPLLPSVMITPSALPRNHPLGTVVANIGEVGIATTSFTVHGDCVSQT